MVLVQQKGKPWELRVGRLLSHVLLRYLRQVLFRLPELRWKGAETMIAGAINSSCSQLPLAPNGFTAHQDGLYSLSLPREG